MPEAPCRRCVCAHQERECIGWTRRRVALKCVVWNWSWNLNMLKISAVGRSMWINNSELMWRYKRLRSRWAGRVKGPSSGQQLRKSVAWKQTFFLVFFWRWDRPWRLAVETLWLYLPCSVVHRSLQPVLTDVHPDLRDRAGGPGRGTNNVWYVSYWNLLLEK